MKKKRTKMKRMEETRKTRPNVSKEKAVSKKLAGKHKIIQKANDVDDDDSGIESEEEDHKPARKPISSANKTGVVPKANEEAPIPTKKPARSRVNQIAEGKKAPKDKPRSTDAPRQKSSTKKPSSLLDEMAHMMCKVTTGTSGYDVGRDKKGRTSAKRPTEREAGQKAWTKPQ